MICRWRSLEKTWTFFYQRCGDFFSVDSSELETMGFALLIVGDCVQVRRLGASVASVFCLVALVL